MGIRGYLLRCRALRFSRSAKAYGVMKEMVFRDNVRSTSRVMFAKSFLFTLRSVYKRDGRSITCDSRGPETPAAPADGAFTAVNGRL